MSALSHPVPGQHAGHEGRRPIHESGGHGRKLASLGLFINKSAFVFVYEYLW